MFGISLARISLLTGSSLGGGVGVSATLDLNFRGQGYSAAMAGYTFNQLIDFTRTSSATYVDATGKIVPTAASRNLLTFTQEFDNAAWVKNGASAYPFDPATATLGPELVTNGTFETNLNGWTVTNVVWSSGAASFTGSPSLSQSLSTVSGATYQVSITVSGLTGGSLWLRFIGGTAVNSSGFGNGVNTFYLRSNGNTSILIEQVSGTITAGSVDNISVKELSGGLITAPDGSLTADVLVEDTSTNVHNAQQSATLTAATHTFSIYLKARERTWAQVLNGTIANGFAYFNLATGVVGTVGAGVTATSITSVGNGWYRCSITFTAASGGNILAVRPASANGTASYTGNGTSGVFLWGAQLEAGSTLTDYTRNNGGVYPPRFDYDPVTLAPRGLLVEEQRTNLLTYSEQFDNAAWTNKNYVTITADTTTSPDGTVDADTMTPDATSAVHRVNRTVTVSASTAYTSSVFIKPNGYTKVALFENATTGAYAAFDCSGSGSVLATGSGGAGTITAVGNGWYRVTLTATTAVAQTSYRFDIYVLPASYTSGSPGGAWTGDGTSGIFVWGAQLEAGSFATSYIPTVASQVTRTADVATITGANFSQWYNQSAGTFVVEADTIDASSATCTAVSASDGSLNNRIQVFFGPTSHLFVRAGNITQADLDGGTIVSNAATRVAGAYAANDFAVSLSGGAVVTDTSGTIPTVDRLNLGTNANSAAQLNGHIRSIRYYPTRLSNAQLQALTA